MREAAMTDRFQLWQKHLRTLSDADLCAVKARGMKRDELCALLEELCERLSDDLVERRCRTLFSLWHRKWQPLCVDCGDDVHSMGEYYMLKDAVWNSAWIGRHRAQFFDGQLCIGCLERRLGRTRMHVDFTDAPVNTERSPRSDRLRKRLAANVGSIKTLDGLIAFAVEGMLEKLPEDRRAAARAAWDASADGPEVA
jgi:hypothetical protein